MTCPGASTPASWPGWWPSTGSTRTRPIETAIDLVTDQPDDGVQAVSVPAAAPDRGPAAGRPHRCGSCTSGSATSSAPISAGTPSMPRTPRLGHRRFHRPRQPVPVDALTEQQGLYTLVTRAADGDRFEVLSSLSRAHVAADHDAWLRYFGDPELAAVTITVTEAGYLRGPDGGLDAGRPEVQADIEALRATPRRPFAPLPPAWSPGSRPGGAPVRVRSPLVPCDNTPGNGWLAAPVVRRPGPARRRRPRRLDRRLRRGRDHHGRPDHPVPTPDDVRAVLESTGLDDRCPVVTEPFHEWVLSGTFPAGRPRWEGAGATFTDDVTPYEHRKLWLLNGAHSLLAYAGSIRGHATVAEAVPTRRAGRGWRNGGRWLRATWTSRPQDIAAYRAALLDASPTRGCATGWTGSPPTARRSSRSASCPSCAPSAPRAGCPPPPPASWRRGSVTCAGRRTGQRRSSRRGRPARWRAARLGRAPCSRLAGSALAADADVVSIVVDQCKQFSCAGQAPRRTAAQS